MGGILAASCADEVELGGLARAALALIYRGHEGAGVAYHAGGALEIRRGAGHPAEVLARLGLEGARARIALLHVRRATRSPPADGSSHPHPDCAGRLALALDGSLDNYEELRRRLEARGHAFRSGSGAELVAHLVEEHSRALDPLGSLVRAARELRGSYAAAMVVAGDPSIYFVTRGRPLVAALSGGCAYVASDASALEGLAREALALEDGLAGAASPQRLIAVGIEEGTSIDPAGLPKVAVEGETPTAGRRRPHWTLEEIYGIPEAILGAVEAASGRPARVAAAIIGNASRTFVVGAGSSYHAAMVAAQYLDLVAGVQALAIPAASFPYAHGVGRGAAVLALSQSGETPEVVEGARLARRRGALVIGLSCRCSSRLALESDLAICLRIGPEVAVHSTKSFAAMVAASLLLSAEAGAQRGNAAVEPRRALSDLRSLATSLRGSLEALDAQATAAASALSGARGMYVAGSGLHLPIALDAALKVKGMAGVHAEGLDLGELAHGHAAIVAAGFPVVLIEPVEPEARPLYRGVYGELRGRGAAVLSVDISAQEPGTFAKLPEVPWYLYPILTSVPLQLLAYRLGASLGRPVDFPPGTAKFLVA
ncbi:MAG: SIS domain-containing protein [Desulfurococcaceae archaeon]